MPSLLLTGDFSKVPRAPIGSTYVNVGALFWVDSVGIFCLRAVFPYSLSFHSVSLVTIVFSIYF